MVKFKGAGTTTKAPDTSGVQRAHEGVMQSMARGQQAAGQAGQLAQSAAGQIQQQDQFSQEQQARKERLDVEMAKGGLQFQGKGTDKRVIPTEAAEAKAGLEERKVDIAEQRAANEERRAAAYEMSQQLSLIKSGYNENGELSDDGRTAIRNLGREYKKQQRLFQALNRGDPAAIQEAQSMMSEPDSVSVESGEGAIGGAIQSVERVVAGVRAALDFAQMKFMVTSKGERPEDAMDDSMAWQSFYGWKQEIASMMKSGQMPVPMFQSIQQRNRYLNEVAARQVLKGKTAPGSMADPSVAQGLVPAQAPAGQPDGGSQQPQPSPSGPGAIANTGSSQASPPWSGVR